MSGNLSPTNHFFQTETGIHDIWSNKLRELFPGILPAHVVRYEREYK